MLAMLEVVGSKTMSCVQILYKTTHSFCLYPAPIASSHEIWPKIIWSFGVHK